MSPVLDATASVARLSSAASGTMARTDSTNSSVWASGVSDCATSTTGTRMSSHSSGVLRMSLSKGMRAPRACALGESIAWRGALDVSAHSLTRATVSLPGLTLSLR